MSRSRTHLRGRFLEGYSPEEKEGAWFLDLPLTEVGHFRAKAYCVDPEGRQHWPGERFRPFGEPRQIAQRQRDLLRLSPALRRGFIPDPAAEIASKLLDREAWTALPPSGKLRDLTAQVPHIFGSLGCRILHLLPRLHAHHLCALRTVRKSLRDPGSDRH